MTQPALIGVPISGRGRQLSRVVTRESVNVYPSGHPYEPMTDIMFIRPGRPQDDRKWMIFISGDWVTIWDKETPRKVTSVHVSNVRWVEPLTDDRDG